MEASDKNTVTTLNHLAEKGYKVSKKKVRISQTKVTYLGFIITEGQRSPPQERKKDICSLASPIEDRLGASWGWPGFCTSGSLTMV